MTRPNYCPAACGRRRGPVGLPSGGASLRVRFRTVATPFTYVNEAGAGTSGRVSRRYAWSQPPTVSRGRAATGREAQPTLATSMETSRSRLARHAELMRGGAELRLPTIAYRHRDQQCSVYDAASRAQRFLGCCLRLSASTGRKGAKTDALRLRASSARRGTKPVRGVLGSE